jgi:L-threonylcarbamoyladenylate synthase
MNHILKSQVQQAVSIINNGGIIAFPTETVYGLGANVFDKKAIQKIFDTKNRPADNPLIVHISSLEMLNKLTAYISPENQRLINAFWPGPLGIVFPKSEFVPDIVTAGLDTVVIRFPDHPIAQYFISECNIPIAAPSVNPSGKPSSTHHNHIVDYFGNNVFVIEGDFSTIGLESTVITTIDKPTILRQGAISQADIQNILKVPIYIAKKNTSTIQSPGMKYKHYAPNSPIKLIPFEKNIISIIQDYIKDGYRIGALVSSEIYTQLPPNIIGFNLGSQNDYADISAHLYDGLHFFDSQNIDIIIAESFQPIGIGVAIMDRLSRAASTH